MPAERPGRGTLSGSIDDVCHVVCLSDTKVSIDESGCLEDMVVSGRRVRDATAHIMGATPGRGRSVAAPESPWVVRSRSKRSFPMWPPARGCRAGGQLCAGAGGDSRRGLHAADACLAAVGGNRDSAGRVRWSSGAARTAISRLARRGVLESSRDGRHSSYRLTQNAADELLAGGAWIARFGEQERPWDELDGRRLLLPEEQSAQRRSLRAKLRWLGFAPLYDGLWVSPDAPNPTVAKRLSDFAFGAMTVFRAAELELKNSTNRRPVDAWDVDAIARHYEDLIDGGDRCSTGTPGQIAGAAAVRARTQIMDTYRHIPLLDPQLPTDLLPPGWPRARARELFVAIYDGLAEQAELHVLAVVGQVAHQPPPPSGHTPWRACPSRDARPTPAWSSRTQRIFGREAGLHLVICGNRLRHA